jgi:hypothetical protein
MDSVVLRGTLRSDIICDRTSTGLGPRGSIIEEENNKLASIDNYTRKRGAVPPPTILWR